MAHLSLFGAQYPSLPQHGANHSRQQCDWKYAGWSTAVAEVSRKGLSGHVGADAPFFVSACLYDPCESFFSAACSEERMSGKPAPTGVRKARKGE
jgi:hypothetical protein